MVINIYITLKRRSILPVELFLWMGRKMSVFLDYEAFNNGAKWIIIGNLTQDVIDLLKLKRGVGDIVLWHDRLKYIEKHKTDFKTEDDYHKHIIRIPQIIKSPDYIGLHPSNKGIEYIKQIDEIMLVGIRINSTGNLYFRSAYPIRNEKLKLYIKSGTVFRV